MGVLQYGDAALANRPRGFSTGGLVTLLVPPDSQKGLEDCSNLLAWRTFKLPRKVTSINGAESQVLNFGEDTLCGPNRMACLWSGTT